MRDSCVDIIIPIHDTPADLLECCFLSVLNQTYDNCNIIAIDDGSTNNDTCAIIDKYKNNKKIKVFSQNNSGVSLARNLGLKKSTNKYILFLDSDDYLEKTYIERLVNTAVRENKTIVFSGKVQVPGMANDAPFNNHVISIEDDDEIITVKLHAFTSQGVLIDGALARLVEFDPKAKMGEDTDYILRVMAHSLNSIYFEGNGGYYYVKHSSNATGGVELEDIMNYLNYSNVLADRVADIIHPSIEIINIFKLLKFSRASKKMAKIKISYLSFKKIFNDYSKRIDFSKIDSRKIKNSRLLSIGEKIRVWLLAKRWLFLLYIINRFMRLTERGSNEG